MEEARRGLAERCEPRELAPRYARTEDPREECRRTECGRSGSRDDERGHGEPEPAIDAAGGDDDGRGGCCGREPAEGSLRAPCPVADPEEHADEEQAAEERQGRIVRIREPFFADRGAGRERELGARRQEHCVEDARRTLA